MPKLGDILIDHVEKESYDEAIDSTNHPVEDGVNMVDHIEKKPVGLSINGIITGKDAATRLAKLREYMNTGKLLKYQYKTSIANVIIESFPHDHIVEIAGNGFEFQMKLKQIRIAKVGTVTTKTVSNKGRQQPKGTTPAKAYVVKPGDNLSKIAAKYKISTQKLYDKNRGTVGANKNLIYPGQKLIIPA